MEINALLSRLHALAPSFGRAQADIEAMISRGQSGDFKGVMQNCRLVLEVLLRALVADELKQTPGKAMLDELITKFRQAANAGLIPPNVLAHMGTVQAWGNLSSHDHASRLTDESVKVGREEVIASLNSMVAILDWYVGRYGQTSPKILPSATLEAQAHVPAPVVQAPALPPPPDPAALPLIPVAPPLRPPAPRRAPVIPLTLAAIALAGVGAFLATRTAPPGAAPLAALDATYQGWAEPAPPPPCRLPEEAPKLVAAAGSVEALSALPATRSAEAWYLLARAQVDKKQDATAAISNALICPGFAAAYNLAGKIAVRDNRLGDALLSYRAALDAAPTFHNARYNLALLHLKEGRTTEGATELQRITHADPKNADAHFMLGLGLEALHKDEDAKREYCAALANGRADARDRCAP